MASVPPRQRPDLVIHAARRDIDQPSASRYARAAHTAAGQTPNVRKSLVFRLIRKGTSRDGPERRSSERTITAVGISVQSGNYPVSF